MADREDIRHDMQVLGSDGGMIGRVDGVEGERIKLKRDAEIAGAQHHYVPMRWVARVDEHVHLDRTAALAREEWTVGDGATPAAAVRSEDRRSNWVPWAVGIVLLLAVLFLGIKGCNYAASEPDYQNSVNGSVDAPGV